VRARGVAWRRLVWVWLPAVVLFLANVTWLVGKSGGRYASVNRDVEAFRGRVAELASLRDKAVAEREGVVQLDDQLRTLYDTVFGNLDKRLTGILRAVGSATWEAGLQPQQFTYDANEEKKLGLTVLGIQFSVDGTYEQILAMLSSLQASDQFFIVDRITIGGEEGTNSTTLSIAVHLSTYLENADPDLLRRLTGGIGGGKDDHGKR